MNRPELKKSVLVIEDHSESCELLKRMLRRRGLHAECAESLAEGISCLEIAAKQGHAFSCVVADLCLPDSNALQTVEALANLRRRMEIPIRAISGYQEPELIEACQRARIKLILKGTTPEGIMESVLYAIAEREPSIEISEMIADNRSAAREVERTGRKWSTAKKFVAGALLLITTMLSSIALGGWFYHQIEDSVLRRQAANSHFEQLDKDIKAANVSIAENATRIRLREESAIKYEGKVDAMKEQLDRIEKKLGEIHQ